MENTPKQIIRVFEFGRLYETNYTKKYEKRTPWVRPNPEEIKSFIPGTVEKILVKVGDNVVAGQEIMIYVAMKMHNVIRAPFAGTVTAISAEEGSKLPRGAVMMVIHQGTIVLPKKNKKKVSMASKRKMVEKRKAKRAKGEK